MVVEELIEYLDSLKEYGITKIEYIYKLSDGSRRMNFYSKDKLDDEVKKQAENLTGIEKSSIEIVIEE